MFRSFGQPIQHMSQHHATMLQDVALKCWERLARPLLIFKTDLLDLRRLDLGKSDVIYSPLKISACKYIAYNMGKTPV